MGSASLLPVWPVASEESFLPLAPSKMNGKQQNRAIRQNPAHIAMKLIFGQNIT